MKNKRSVEVRKWPGPDDTFFLFFHDKKSQNNKNREERKGGNGLLKTGPLFKMERMKFRQVSLQEINLEEKKFCLSPLVEFESLKASIGRVGLLVPPLVKPEKEALILITGWRRVLACKHLSLTTIPVLLVPEDMSDLDLLVRAIEENLSTRPLSLAEKAEAIYKLNLFGLSPERIMADYFSRFALPRKKEYFLLLIKLAGQGQEKLKKFLHGTEISLDALDLFFSFSTLAQEKLMPFLQAVTYSRRREIIENLYEISLREGRAVDNLLEHPEIKSILERNELSFRSRGEALSDWLKKRRYPLLTSWEAEIKKILKELAWPEEVKLLYDPTFESPELEIFFSFRNLPQFLARLDELKAIAQKPAFQKLFRRSLEK